MSPQNWKVFVLIVLSLVSFVTEYKRLSSVETPSVPVVITGEIQPEVTPTPSLCDSSRIAYITISPDGFSQAFYIDALNADASQFWASEDSTKTASLRWSPDGQKLVFFVRQHPVNNPVYHLINIATNHVTQPTSSTFGDFGGWTADSRYALFSYFNQYGDHATDVYDVEDGQLVFPTEDDRRRYYPPFGKLEFGLAEISPISACIRLENGLLIDFSTHPKSVLTGVSSKSIACFSPEAYLTTESTPVLCQDSKIVLPGESTFGQAQVIRWSSDCAFFAVGRSGGLEIYAADQTLLNTFPTTATVTYLAWSPLCSK